MHMHYYALKSDGLVGILVQKHNRCEIENETGAKHMLYLQDKMLWTYLLVQAQVAAMNWLRMGVYMDYYTLKSDGLVGQKHNRCGIMDRTHVM